jgi:hypothetical protein
MAFDALGPLDVSPKTTYFLDMAIVSIDAARRVKDLARDVVSRSADVTGVGLVRRGASYAVKVNLRGGVPPGLPQQIDGVPLEYEQTGIIGPQ